VSDVSPLSISELNFRIKAVLEGGLPLLWVRGEVSQFTPHRSGHWYFTLSDDRSQISCVLWRGRSESVPFVPQVGQMVIAQGKVTVYEKGGRYQFDCFEMRPAGIGELALAFEALKKKLDAEGLFSMERKIPLPESPERIGIVTSPDGAALQDILKVARKRAPWAEFRIAPAAVQGSGAAAEIARSIKLLDESGWAQVIIVGRGGGSPEDLWAFNEEVVVRAIAECRTPIISAVGHEVDVTLADFAADVRAPTPSAAAETCLPDQIALKDRLDDLTGRLDRSISHKVTELRRWLTESVQNSLRQSISSIWREQSMRTDELSRRFDTAYKNHFQRIRAQLDQLITRHQALSPLAVLARGYSIVRLKGTETSIKHSADLAVNDEIDITFHEGAAGAVIKTRQIK
jgi:exodeoxyribonuclease VII large subunit